MAEYLPDDEHGLLGHRPRRPQVSGDPIRVGGTVLENGDDARAPLPVFGQTLAHEPSMIGDRVTMTGQQPVKRH